MRTYTQGPITGPLSEKFSWTVRRARKTYYCAIHPASLKAQQPAINAGDFYVEGDVDPYEAGGFGHERYCLACADKWADEIEDRVEA